MTIIDQLKIYYAENPAKALNLLPELFRQADEGKIVELPCKVGDTVYAENPYGKADFVPKERFVEPWKVKHVGVTMECSGWGKEVDFDQFSKTVFLTREAAEKALKESES